ncbi:DUF1877 family protein [Actinomadura scrupuli]|uniref:DUF1877 family protein n=1 Tax=Actinomadura scrupuli TaxID=559629 RepID=UPI003D980BAE
MAITQQIARVSEKQFAACRQSADELNRLCSFELRPQSDYADLDWAGSAMIRVCELADLDARIVAALRRALDGDAELNAAYRDHPDTVWEHPVTALDPTAVAQVSGVLGKLEPQAVLAALPSDPHEATAAIGENWENFEGDLRGYLARHFTALLSFYEETAQRNLAVVLWWD